jgi:hypothetical protein
MDNGTISCRSAAEARAARLSRGRILRYSQRNLQATGFIGGSVEDASTELELATRQIDGERELQRGTEEPVVLRRCDCDLEGLAAGGNELAEEVESAEVELDGGLERLEVVDESGSNLEMILPVIAVVGQV